MSSLFVALAAIALVVVLAVHAAMLVLLATRKPRYHALVALVVPVLLPYWAWRRGARALVYAWGAGVVLYALGVAVVSR